MGIPKYFHLITQTYPNVIRTSLPETECTDFFFDYNGVIHHVANNVLAKEGLSEDDVEPLIFQELWEYTTKCTDIVNANRMIHICIDGVAPVAKLNQQRKRRFLSIFQKKLTNAEVLWDRNAISPGTPFMVRLHAFLASKIRANISLHRPPMYLSTSDESGEGEHKMFARIHHLPTDSNIVVHGLDADLIMLSLLTHRPNIYLMREPSGHFREWETKEGFLYVDIDALRKAILQELVSRYEWPIPADARTDPYSQSAKRVIETYVIACFLLGNDFLPHLLTVSLHNRGHEQILFAVRDCMIAGLNDPMSIPFLAKLFEILATSEDKDLQSLNEKYVRRRHYTSVTDPSDGYPIQHKDPLAMALMDDGFSPGWRKIYYKHMLHTRMTDTATIACACKTYVQGIFWTWKYYTRAPKDPLWYYPWGYPPTLRDIANFLSGMTTQEEQVMFANFTTPWNQGFVHPHVQLCCIMPRESAPILPKKVRDAMQNSELGITHLFPTEFVIQTYLKQHLWECNPVLPLFDISFLNKKII
jgi:5'-3' exonuclease